MRQAPETFFPELEGDERAHADAWLHDYLQLVIRIHREHVEAIASTSKISTVTSLTDSTVLARSVHGVPTPAPPQSHEEVLRVHSRIDGQAG